MCIRDSHQGGYFEFKNKNYPYMDIRKNTIVNLTLLNLKKTSEKTLVVLFACDCCMPIILSSSKKYYYTVER